MIVIVYTINIKNMDGSKTYHSTMKQQNMFNLEKYNDFANLQSIKFCKFIPIKKIIIFET
jgi:hypothetical protein